MFQKERRGLLEPAKTLTKMASLLDEIGKAGLPFLLASCLLAWFFPIDVFAATPVDIYQDMESGNNGDVLTPAMMNTSNRGAGTWSAPGGSLWASNRNPQPYPAPVIVGGATVTSSGGSRTWMVNDNNDNNYVTITFPSAQSHVTVACFLTIGPNCNAWGLQFDTYGSYGIMGKTFAVLQMTSPASGQAINAHSKNSSGTSTFGAKIPVSPGHTYWTNLHYDGAAGKTSVAIFEPQTWAQVGNISEAVSTPDDLRAFHFGRMDAHGDCGCCTTQTLFDHILIDYTNAAFPLLPLSPLVHAQSPSNRIAVNPDRWICAIGAQRIELNSGMDGFSVYTVLGRKLWQYHRKSGDSGSLNVPLPSRLQGIFYIQY